MTETLVIRLRASDDAPASWLIVDGNGARSGPVQSGPVADALPLAQGRRTVLILPAAEATLAVPGTARARRRSHRAGRAVRARRTTGLRSRLDAFRRRLAHASTVARHAGGHGCAADPRALAGSTWEAAGIHPDAAYSESSLVPVRAERCVLRARRRDAARAATRQRRLTRSTRSRWTSRSNSRSVTAEPAEHVTFYATPDEYERNKRSHRRLARAHRDAAGQAAARRHAAAAGGADSGRTSGQRAAGRLRAAVVIRHAVQAVAPAHGTWQRRRCSRSSPPRA